MIKYSFPALLAILICLSCSDDSVEPDQQAFDFSRLYVSLEEYGTSNSGLPDTNIRVVRRADSTVFSFDTTHLSPARGGGPIYFNPFLKALIQASANPTGANDPSLYVVNINDKGELANTSASMTSSFFSSVKGLAYHRASDALFVVNANGENSGIYVVDRPKNMSRNQKPRKNLFTGNLPMWGAAYKSNQLFVSKQGDNGGIYVFDNIATVRVNPVDSSAQFAPSRTLEIDGAKNLRGLCYDTLKNVLAITDYTDGTTVGTGRILIFEAFGTMLSGSKLEPTRIITGAATQLTQPVDVAIDSRATGQYIYVADKTKKIFRFKITDNGNVQPDKILDTEEFGTPVGLALDSRDESTIPLF